MPRHPWILLSLGVHFAALTVLTLGVLVPQKAKPIPETVRVELVSTPHSTVPQRSHAISKASRPVVSSHAAVPASSTPTGASAPSAAPAAVSGSHSQGSSSELAQYISMLVQRIDAVKDYPEESVYRGEQGRVVVGLKILPDGTVSHFHLAEACPFERLNHAALDTLVRLGRLAPLPAGRRVALTLQIPIHFELSRSSSSSL